MKLSPEQISAIEALLATGAAAFGGPAVGAAVSAAESIVNATLLTPGTVGAVPAQQMAPLQQDPNAHPVVAAMGRAAQVPTPVATGEHPVDSAGQPDYSFPDIYDRCAAVEAKLNALIAAVGMVGSASMAAHP